jgi:hypothetical protein
MFFAGSSTTNFRTFNCDGTGVYKDDSLPPGNQGSFRWGYALSPTDKTKLDVRPAKDFEFPYLEDLGLNKSMRAFVQICFQFTSGGSAGRSARAVLGEFNGKQQYIGVYGGFWQSQ